MPVVLVVDDSPVDRRLVGGLLGKSPNIEITYAADGEEALRAMDQAAPNLVVTDLIMPNMDGLELVAAVVQKEGKIIATTPKSHIITYDILDQ